jgi:hypothetical protein
MALHNYGKETKSLKEEGKAELKDGNYISFSEIIDGKKPVALLRTSKTIRHCKKQIGNTRRFYMYIFCSAAIPDKDLQTLLDSYDSLFSEFATLGYTEQQVVECKSVVVARHDINIGKFIVLNERILKFSNATVQQEWQDNLTYRNKAKGDCLPWPYDYIEENGSCLLQ